MARLQSALDSEIKIAVERFIADGVSPDISSLYSAIQRSNSSLKRKPKKVLESSIERVLDFIEATGDDDPDLSAEEAEKAQSYRSSDPDSMNRSLRANLMPPSSPPAREGARKHRLANGEPAPKRQKAEKITMAPPTEVSLKDIGGMDDVIEQMGELLILPLLDPESYRYMNLGLPRGILLHGPPGCGKTMITRAFAARLGLPFIEIPGPSIVSSMSGDSEKAIRDRFEEAKKNAPCLIFIDELDSIAPKRESSQSQMEKRIVAQLLVSMDELGRDYERPVIVLAATNRPDSLDPALRRAGRFDTEINISVPGERVREQILRAQTRNTPLKNDVDFGRLAKMTAGFVGADLQDLIAKAGSWQMRHYREALQKQALVAEDLDGMDVEAVARNTFAGSEKVIAINKLISRLQMRHVPKPSWLNVISMDAFLSVLPGITPSSKREGFATIPDVSWQDIGALQKVRDELKMSIIQPIKEPERYRALGISAPAGVLLWGPPGCGKTLLAKATAAESKTNFISVKGPELLNKFVGESEAAVRKVFERARSSVPCIIFFDELDALAPRREDSGSEASARVVNTLLTELDGLDDRTGIYVIGATNRPDMIDEAMLRPGRLETPLFVDLPREKERVEILTTLLRNKPVEGLAEIAALARTCENFSGADLGSLVREAAHCTLRRRGDKLEMIDFVLAKQSVSGSVKDIARYHSLRERFGHR